MQPTDPTLDPDYVEHLLDELAPAMPGDPDSAERRRAAAKVALLGAQPADPMAALLAVQAIAAHEAVMQVFRRAAQEGLDGAASAKLLVEAGNLSRIMQAALQAAEARREPTAGAVLRARGSRVPLVTRPLLPRKPPEPPLPRWETLTMAERWRVFGGESRIPAAPADAQAEPEADPDSESDERAPEDKNRIN